MKNYCACIALISISGSFTFSQNEFAQNWHFGEGVHLDFSSGSPVAGSNSAMYSYEGCLSPSDDAGNLLFYSNGGNIHDQNDGFVWNSNHLAMPNGQLFDTAGCYSAIQSSVVIPVIGSMNEHYLFTMDCAESIGSSLAHYKGLRYSLVDMNLAGGLGDLTQVGVPILGDSTLTLTEGMEATAHSNGIDYWLVVHSEGPLSSNRFYVFQITSSGISAPSIQDIGVSSYGQMKISLDGKYLSYGSQLYDFDNSTGILSNAIDLGVSGSGKAFSGNGRYLYQTDVVSLYQYDLLAANIAGSRTTIHTGSIFDLEIKASMQQGPDCKIYVAQFQKPYIGVINSPNLGGASCNYVNAQVGLIPGTSCQAGLPHFIDSDFRSCNTSSIDEESTSLLHLYPNPVDDQMNLDVDHSLLGSEYRITDVSGKVAQTGFFTELSTISTISHLAPGVYFLNVIGNEEFVRFVKK